MLISLTFAGPDRKKIKFGSTQVRIISSWIQTHRKFFLFSLMDPHSKSSMPAYCIRFIPCVVCVQFLQRKKIVMYINEYSVFLYACNILIMGFADFLSFRMMEGKIHKMFTLSDILFPLKLSGRILVLVGEG